MDILTRTPPIALIDKKGSHKYQFIYLIVSIGSFERVVPSTVHLLKEKYTRNKLVADGCSVQQRNTDYSGKN